MIVGEEDLSISAGVTLGGKFLRDTGVGFQAGNTLIKKWFPSIVVLKAWDMIVLTCYGSGESLFSLRGVLVIKHRLFLGEDYFEFHNVISLPVRCNHFKIEGIRVRQCYTMMCPRWYGWKCFVSVWSYNGIQYFFCCWRSFWWRVGRLGEKE